MTTSEYQGNLNVGCNYYIPPPKPLAYLNGNMEITWRLWRQQYEWFEIAAQLETKPADVQVAIFMLTIGTAVSVIYNSFDFSATDRVDVETIKTAFQNYFISFSNKSFEEYTLNKIVQEGGEHPNCEPTSELTDEPEKTTLTGLATSSTEQLNETSLIDLLKSLSELETLNDDDCIRDIFQDLNILNVVNLTTLCKRLLHFASSEWFPKEAKKINIIGIDKENFRFTTTMDNTFTYTSALTMKSLEDSIKCFGEFVEDLNLKNMNSTIVMDHCPNLRRLCLFTSTSVTPEQIYNIQDCIKRLQNLDELDLRRCDGITGNWPVTPESISTVKKLSMSTMDDFTCDFFKYFRHLSSLTIDFVGFTKWKAENLEEIFDNIGHNLQHLKLSETHNLQGCEAVATIITDKLPKLEKVELKFHFSADLMSLIELPHLKALEIRDYDDSTINTHLRTLSDKKIIEELTIYGFTFDEKDANEAPLDFNKLQSLCCYMPRSISRFLKLATRSQMPAIKNFTLFDINSDEISDLLKFFESKNTLESISLLLDDPRNLTPYLVFEFLVQIIEILKIPSKPKRPFLKLKIYSRNLREEAVSNNMPVKLKYIINYHKFSLQFQMKFLEANRHLIQVSSIFCEHRMSRENELEV